MALRFFAERYASVYRIRFVFSNRLAEGLHLLTPQLESLGRDVGIGEALRFGYLIN